MAHGNWYVLLALGVLALFACFSDSWSDRMADLVGLAWIVLFVAWVYG